MRVRVVTDSSASVPDEYLARLGIGEALATVNFGSESYFAKAEVPLETFYRRLETADKLPTTSQPAPEQFARAYERAAAAGADEILAVCVSSQLSGTLQQRGHCGPGVARAGAGVGQPTHIDGGRLSGDHRG